MVECEKNMNFEECEITILRHAVDEAEKLKSKTIIENPQIKKIIDTVEKFIKNKRLICYGGTAINNLLPKRAQFYDRSLELPDYDFYSPNALDDAKELANIYYANGFTDVEAKAGVHYGTYKVFVNFMPVADITILNKSLFSAIKKDATKINGILYAPINFLRMSMYLELSRPYGDVSRWEKVLKRLILLNKHYHLKGKNCKNVEIQRAFKSTLDKKLIFDIVLKTVSNHHDVLFGGYASHLYSKYMSKSLQKKLKKNPDFDVLSENPQELAQRIKNRLEENNIEKVSLYYHDGIGEVISPHYEVSIDKETIAFIYEPMACHSYNLITHDDLTLKIATIDTMLSFYLAFLYANRPYYDKNRILCMTQYLFNVQQHNRLKQEGVLKRFSMNCYGKQKTILNLREQKAEKYKQLKNKKDSREYEEWFLKYDPSDSVYQDHTKRSKSLKVLKSKGNKKTRKKKKAY